jgi:hypothetical protein
MTTAKQTSAKKSHEWVSELTRIDWRRSGRVAATALDDRLADSDGCQYVLQTLSSRSSRLPILLLRGINRQERARGIILERSKGVRSRIKNQESRIKNQESSPRIKPRIKPTLRRMVHIDG